MLSWNRFREEFRKDLKQWLFFMLTLSFFRVILIVYFRDKIDAASSGTDVAKALMNGMRFDGMAATYFILFPLALSIVCGIFDPGPLISRLKRIYSSLFIVLTTVLSIVTLVYFREYNDQFNHFVFNLYYDDTRAILSTIWSGYHVIPNLLAIAALSLLLMKASSLLLKTRLSAAGPSRPLPVALRVLAVLFGITLLLAGTRGSYGHRPAKIEDAAVTRDVFLNKAVLNPYSALMYAYTEHLRLNYVMAGLKFWLPDQDIRKAAQELLHDRRSLDDLDQYARRTAQGHRNRQPKQIFLVVMESYDAWPLMARYASLGLTPELGAIASKGIHITHFLPASDGTATSLTALVSGLADANVITNYQPSSRSPYPSSIAESFKRLGYRTRFFYGGYLSWQKIGDFMKGQGFDEVYGAAHIGSWASHNEWGVEDEALFDFIVKTVEPAASRPGLNVIMTTSYHPPYELDVYGKGFPLTAVPTDLAGQFDGTVTLKMLGHLWYSDRCIGEFVRSADRRFPGSLFAFTGDHFGRKFINTHPPKYEASAVPFILYGKDVLREVAAPAQAAGSHIDIAPTLIELSAPKGFVYFALGRNLLGPGANRTGVNRDRVITSEYLYDIWEKKFYPIPGKPLPKQLPDPGQLKLVHDRVAAISWWRIMRGTKL